MFGTITFLYEPSTEGFPAFTDAEDPSDPRVSVQFSSEADLSDMTGNFERFLRAIGYPLDYDEFLVLASGEESQRGGEPSEHTHFSVQDPVITINDTAEIVAKTIADRLKTAVASVAHSTSQREGEPRGQVCFHVKDPVVTHQDGTDAARVAAIALEAYAFLLDSTDAASTNLARVVAIALENYAALRGGSSHGE